MIDARAVADDLWETPLPSDEFERRLRAALLELDGPEGDELRELVAWFLRRYPEPLDRLAYARRKAREAETLRGRAHDPLPRER